MEDIARPCGGYRGPYAGGSARDRTGVFPVNTGLSTS